MVIVNNSSHKNLLAFYRPSANRLSAKPWPFDLSKLTMQNTLTASHKKTI